MAPSPYSQSKNQFRIFVYTRQRPDRVNHPIRLFLLRQTDLHRTFFVFCFGGAAKILYEKYVRTNKLKRPAIKEIYEFTNDQQPRERWRCSGRVLTTFVLVTAAAPHNHFWSISRKSELDWSPMPPAAALTLVPDNLYIRIRAGRAKIYHILHHFSP